MRNGGLATSAKPFSRFLVLLGALLIAGALTAFALAGHAFAVVLISWLAGYLAGTAAVYLATLCRARRGLTAFVLLMVWLTVLVCVPMLLVLEGRSAWLLEMGTIPGGFVQGCMIGFGITALLGWSKPDEPLWSRRGLR